MTVKTIQTTTDTLRLGRNRPVARCSALLLGNYLTRGYAAPPAACNWTAAAEPALKKMYLNNKLGCCVIAWGAHMEGVLTGNASGAPIIYTDKQIANQYSAIGGYVPGDASTDQGCDEETALNYWVQHGFAGGTKIAAWMRVNGADPGEVRAAIDLFGTVTFTAELPDAWIQNAPRPGFVWAPAGPSDPNNGHCFGAASYTPTLFGDCTWGMQGSITPAAVAEYCVPAAGGGCYTVGTQDWI